MINRELKVLGNLKDRGRIKWTAMMLPEHIQRLREWHGEDALIERPELTEWDLELIQEEIEVAYRRKCQTRIETWKGGKLILHQGTIEELDARLKYIVFEDPFGTERIPVSTVTRVQSLD